ncbi:MAG: dockerin type I repeat-containing protein, partial [Clostridia bacterium]|nr:dockerin type I repeat-containing protein [Clostridia bacterium]
RLLFSEPCSIAEIELLGTEQVQPDVFEQWTDTSDAIYHLGVANADASDSFYDHYRYVAQEFVPTSSKLYGAKIALNLTGGNATVHVEVRKNVNGNALFTKEIPITSQGNAVHWYTLDFGECLTLVSGETYYLVYYLSQKDAGNICIAHGSILNPNEAKHPGYTWQMSSGQPVTFDADQRHLVFAMELITQNYFTSWTDNLNPLYHVGLSSATSTDPHWNDYRYIAQPFVPESDTLYGVHIPLNLTNGNATLHTEIRSSLNGEALASCDTIFTSQGNGMYWYDAPLDTPLTVDAGKTYYLVYYLTDRQADSVCIAYGTDLGTNNATHPGAVWQMSGGTPVAFDTMNNQLQFGFKLMSADSFAALGDQAAAKMVQDQIDSLNVQSLEDKPAVVAAREAYNSLTDGQKTWVTNLAKLETAEEKIAQLEQAAALLYGDVDGDGEVAAADALEVLKAVVGNVTLTADQKVVADVDGDDKVSSADALYILKKVVGKIQKFPVEE